MRTEGIVLVTAAILIALVVEPKPGIAAGFFWLTDSLLFLLGMLNLIATAKRRERF